MDSEVNSKESEERRSRYLSDSELQADQCASLTFSSPSHGEVTTLLDYSDDDSHESSGDEKDPYLAAVST